MRIEHSILRPLTYVAAILTTVSLFPMPGAFAMTAPEGPTTEPVETPAVPGTPIGGVPTIPVPIPASVLGAPLVCSIDGCGMTPGEGRGCGQWQMYEVDAKVNTGNGTAEVWVSCGSSKVTCTLGGSNGLACHAEFAKGPGSFECKWKPISGAIDVVGTCKDPANPWAIYSAVLEPYTGTPLPEA